MSAIDQLKINHNFRLISLFVEAIDDYVNGVNPATKVCTIVE